MGNLGRVFFSEAKAKRIDEFNKDGVPFDKLSDAEKAKFQGGGSSRKSGAPGSGARSLLANSERGGRGLASTLGGG